MPGSATITAHTLRADQRQLSHRPAMARLWQVIRGEWQRKLDRATARSVRELDHAGVSEDYRVACRGNYR